MIWLARRVVHATGMLLLISFFSFLLMQAAPGDFFDEMRLNSHLSPETISALKTRYGTDQPVAAKYLHWCSSVLHGDFGYSVAYSMPASPLILPRAENTLLLTVAGMLTSWVLALAIGSTAAVTRVSWVRRLITSAMSLLVSAPELLVVLGLMMAAAKAGLYPAAQDSGSVLAGALNLILPLTALTLVSLPVVVRHTHTAMREAVALPFVLAARANGLPRSRILLRYTLPACAPALISLLGLSIGALLSSSLVIEVAIGWPGLGPLFLEAIFSRDPDIVVSVTVLSAAFLIAGNLVADVLLYVVDPRIRRAE